MSADPAATQSTWQSVTSSTEFISAMVSLAISGGFTLLSRRQDKKDHVEKLSSERNYQQKLFYYQNTVLKTYESLSAFSYSYRAIVSDCIDEIHNTSNMTSTKKKKIVESHVEKLDKINKTFELDVLLKARIVSDEYSTKLAEIWGSFYDDVVSKTTTLTKGNFATQSLTIYAQVNNRQEVFLVTLISFTKSQHPELK